MTVLRQTMVACNIVLSKVPSRAAYLVRSVDAWRWA
jgi:hypothetical protein